ncbi:MAG: hypothetical protein P4L22_05470 [Candidatus Babeliales bacterium]|nr:hypothetical protein [Candidatus Babeliales bacterium]
MKLFRILSLFFILVCSTAQGNYFLGEYGTPYNILNEIHSKPDLTSQDIIDFAPNSLKIALSKELGVAVTELKAKLNSISASYYFSIFGEPVFGPVPSKTYNIAFHNEVRDWFTGTPKFNPKEFIVDIRMGLFKPINVKQPSSPIAFNKFNPESVSIHSAGLDYSPNNVRFLLEPGKKVGTFWAAAISPDKKKAIITFNIIIDNKTIENAISKFLNSYFIATKTGKIPLANLIQGIKTLSTKFDPATNATLLNIAQQFNPAKTSVAKEKLAKIKAIQLAKAKQFKATSDMLAKQANTLLQFKIAQTTKNDAKIKKLTPIVNKIKKDLITARVNIKNPQGQTPMMLNPRLIFILYGLAKTKAQNTANARDNKGQTVLQYLIQSSWKANANLYKILINAGAQVTDKDIKTIQIKLKNKPQLKPIVSILQQGKKLNKGKK